MKSRNDFSDLPPHSDEPDLLNGLFASVSSGSPLPPTARLDVSLQNKIYNAEDNFDFSPVTVDEIREIIFSLKSGVLSCHTVASNAQCQFLFIWWTFSLIVEGGTCDTTDKIKELQWVARFSSHQYSFYRVECL